MHHIAGDALKRHHQNRKPHGHRTIVDRHAGRHVRRRKRTKTKGRSGPISRVLSRTVIYLGTHVTVRLLARYPGAGRADP